MALFSFMSARGNLLNKFIQLWTVRQEWTDARRPVPRLWIRSAEERGERRYENRNTTTVRQVTRFNLNWLFGCDGVTLLL